jgi:hypothetical protein
LQFRRKQSTAVKEKSAAMNNQEDQDKTLFLLMKKFLLIQFVIFCSLNCQCQLNFNNAVLSKDSLDKYFRNNIVEMKLVSIGKVPNDCKKPDQELALIFEIDSLKLTFSWLDRNYTIHLEEYFENNEIDVNDYTYSIYPKKPTEEVNFLYTFSNVSNNKAYIQSYDRNKRRLRRPEYLVFELRIL